MVLWVNFQKVLVVFMDEAINITLPVDFSISLISVLVRFVKIRIIGLMTCYMQSQQVCNQLWPFRTFLD